MDFVYDFLQQFVLAAVPVVVPFVVAWLIAKTRESWKKVRAEQPYIAGIIEDAAKMAVAAAEQSNIAGFVEDKKAYALDIAEAWLAAQKITVDIKLIEAAIESAVYQEFNKTVPSE